MIQAALERAKREVAEIEREIATERAVKAEEKLAKIVAILEDRIKGIGTKYEVDDHYFIEAVEEVLRADS